MLLRMAAPWLAALALVASATVLTGIGRPARLAHADDSDCAQTQVAASPRPTPSATHGHAHQNDEDDACDDRAGGNSQAAHDCTFDDGDADTHGDHGRCVSDAAHNRHASPSPIASPASNGSQNNGHGNGHGGNGHGR